MKKVHFIAMDVHGKRTVICCKTSVQSKLRQWEVETKIPALREVIESIPGPRKLVFEEGPLADWLFRELRHSVDEMMVSDPRRNALIAKDGDKDDPIDAQKLCDLQMGGYLREVHHSDCLQRVIFKRQVSLYHDRVEHRVAEANRIIGMLKGWGVVVLERDFQKAEGRRDLLQQVAEHGGSGPVAENLRLLWRGYDESLKQEQKLHQGLVKLARREEIIARLIQLPGIAFVRAATFVAYLDTPWRFKSKEALWKYMGIGLVREHSGEGRTYVHVELSCNRRLKSMIMGASESVMMGQDNPSNPFAWQYKRWLERGISPRNAKRNVARSMSAVMWGMWKNGGVYEPQRVGQAK
jgi:transposase